MKSAFFLALAGAGLPVLNAAEPIHQLSDLVKLEARVEAVADKVMPATVALISEETESSGSGVIANAAGLVLTAAHVVQGTDEITVVFPNGEQEKGKVLGANFSKDIAMVQIQGKGPYPFVEVGDSKPLAAGDWVVALGHSAGFDAARTPPVRFGHVVSKGPGNFLTSDCTLIGGDSGGPLFNLDGKVVGINSSIGYSLKNNNHAGVDGFRADWKDLMAGKKWGRLSMDPFENPEMPVLGIQMGQRRDVKGVPVENFYDGSPAAAAGVRANDVIQSIDGETVRNREKLRAALAKRQPGDKVKLGILRDGVALTIPVTLVRHDAIFE